MQMDVKALVSGMARFGYAARGVVHVVVGALALAAAIGSGGEATGSRGALHSLYTQPFGYVILAVIALGLLGYSAWRLIDAVFDTEDRGTEPKGIAIRLIHAGSGVIYLMLAISAFGLLIGKASRRDDDAGAQDWTAWLLQQPFGRWLVGAVGFAIIGAGVVMLITAWKARFTKHLKCTPEHERWIIPVGRLGYTARAIVFGIIGGFLVLAAATADSEQAHGIGGALEELQKQPYGWALLGVVAVGLFAFGVFGFVQAKFRSIEPPTSSDMPDFARS
jgi:hypothetical protein